MIALTSRNVRTVPSRWRIPRDLAVCITCSHKSYLWRVKKKNLRNSKNPGRIRTKPKCWKYTGIIVLYDIPSLKKLAPSMKKSKYIKFTIAETTISVYLDVPVSGNHDFIFINSVLISYYWFQVIWNWNA